MEKIPTVFVRDALNRARVLPIVSQGCEWVTAGEGVATRKLDGTCVRLRASLADGLVVSTRREVRPGRRAPAGFEAVATDPTTGKTVGWEPYAQSPFVAPLMEALSANADGRGLVEWESGTYELIGPKINGNPEACAAHRLVRHGSIVLDWTPRDFDGLRDYLLANPWEGIVWHHPDGRMAKLKRRDFANEREQA